MSRHKQKRFQHNQEAYNVIERGKELYTTIKGKWNFEYFKNENPIVLELACGKGEYTVGLGETFPEKNFIGIDIKGDRIARGSQKALEKKLSNVAFLRSGIQYLEEFFQEGDISEMWLIHPDPQPRDKEEKRRLTNEYFLNLYKLYLKREGLFYLKTDSAFLFEYSFEKLSQDPDFEILEYTNDLLTSPLSKEYYQIETYYGKLFEKKGHTLHFLKARKK
ncbi:MAG: tRNA (guanosine(46)-N7)-methyltransferase TrmB [Leadbetterella sp.]